MKRISLFAIVAIAIMAVAYFTLNNQSTDTSINMDYGDSNAKFRYVEHKDLSPYAMFGDSSIVLLTDAERYGKQFIEIFNTDELSETHKIEFDQKAAKIRFYNKANELIKEELLEPEMIAKFLSVDPRADKYDSWSPYNYVLGNPIRNIDPNGDTVRIMGSNGTYDWTPGASYNGPTDNFVENTFLALNTLASSGVGKLGFKDPSGNMIVGNVLTDFVGEGRFSTSTISISEITDGKTLYGAGTINFDATAGLMINPTAGHQGGAQSPMVALLHEFGHAWLDNVNPALKEQWKGSYYMPSSDMKPWKYHDNKEHFYILEYLENPAARQLGQSTRNIYRGAYWNDAAGQSATNPNGIPKSYKGYDLYYRTINSISTQPR